MSLSGPMEDDLRAIVSSDLFRSAWANWRFVMLGGGIPNNSEQWDNAYKAAKTLAIGLGLYDGNPIYSSDVWQRVMLEAGVLA